MTPVSFLRDSEKPLLKGLMAVGILSFLAALYFYPGRAWANLLLGNVYFVSLCLAAACFIAIQYLSTAGWSVVFRRVAEAMTAYLPIGALCGVALIFGSRYLYPWADAALVAADPVLQARRSFMNIDGFGLRTIAFFALWIYLIKRMLNGSVIQKWIPAAYLVVFGATFSVAAVDWTMSLEPHWYSTIYPWFLFVGAFLNSLACLAAFIVILRRRGHFREVNEHHLHDLGKFVFAFSVFWAYLWFSQYLLIWYSNIPEETTFYIRRLSGGWGILFWLTPIVNFIAPFFLLLKIRQKRNSKFLLWSSGVIAAGQWLNLYVLIMPAVDVNRVFPRLPDLGIFLGLASAFVLSFDHALGSKGYLPQNDPLLEESLHHHG